jgi:pimeloyl-ACP methyl ester carboxylesterase
MTDRIDVGELTIAFERSGNGPALVLLHGGLSDHREWRRQIDALSDGFAVVAWDAPGCGGSSDPPASFRMPDFADSLAAFVGALELGRPHVLGLSWGSTLALELYRRHPSIPRTLVLAAPYAGWAGSLPDMVVEERLRTALRDLALPPEGFVRTWLPSLLTERATDATAEEVIQIMSDFHPEGARAMLHAMAEADLRDVLPEIEAPTLVLCGEEDQRSPRAVAEEMHARIPGSTLVVIPEAGHQSNIEAADRFNAEVRHFLSSR